MDVDFQVSPLPWICHFTLVKGRYSTLEGAGHKLNHAQATFASEVVITFASGKRSLVQNWQKKLPAQ